MNEYLKWIAENIDVEEYWPNEKPYVSVYSSHLRYKTVRFHSESPSIGVGKLPNWFTKEEVIKAQQHLKQKEWVSFEESGVPPVGTLLMNWAKEKREVVLVCDDHVVCRTFEGKTGYKAYYFNHWESYKLSPWKEKTDEEIDIEKMIMELLYKEIKSGNIKI